MPSKSKKNKSPLLGRVIAILGTSGFIGARLLEELEKDERVEHLIIIDRKRPAIDVKKGKFYLLDLTDTFADARLAEIFKSEGVHTVIHAASPNTPPRNPSLVHEIISVGTMYVCNACADAKVQKLILSSTTEVYGALPDNPNFLTEEHPLRGGGRNRFIADKIDAEKSALRLAKKHPHCKVTILRPTHIIGPTIHTFKTSYLTLPVVPTILGYDPLVQFIHEFDVVRAFLLALEKEVSGIFNLVAPGVLPLTRVLRMAGKIHLPIPEFFMKRFLQGLWYADLSPAPAIYLNFLKYLCIAEGEKAAIQLGFQPQFSTREALLAFIGSARLREINLDQFEMNASHSNL